MRHPAIGDLLIESIRRRTPMNAEIQEFVITDALTRRVLSGPYASFADAAARATAHAIKVGVNVWQATEDAANGLRLELALQGTA